MIRFTSWPVQPVQNSLRYPLSKTLIGIQSLWTLRRRKQSQTNAGNRNNFTVAQPVVDLHYNYSNLAPVFNYTELRYKFSKIVQESRVVSSVRGVHVIQEYHIHWHIFTKTEVRMVRKPPTLNFVAATCAKTNLFAFTKFLSSRCFWILITVIFSKIPRLGQEDNWIKILELFSLPSTTQKSDNILDSLKHICEMYQCFGRW
jgi:hypothetical protein